MYNIENEKLLDDIYAAWCRHDSEAVASYFDNDCVYEDMAMGVVFKGRNGVREFALEVFKTMPNFHVVYIDRFANNLHGAGHWKITARWQGDFEGHDCTGQRIEFTGLSYYRFKNGKVSHAQDCWDSAVMMKAFGVLATALRGLK